MTKVLLGYDGSPSAAEAIDVAARLLPGADATVLHLWTAPSAEPAFRDQLAARADSLSELIALMEQEGSGEAERMAANGAALAAAAGWNAKPEAKRVYGGAGYELARCAEEMSVDLAVVGSRGLTGVKAVLGSTSDLLVHVSSVPVLVVRHRLLTEERAAAESGPIVVAFDGSDGALKALAAASSTFAGRDLIVATVDAADAEPVGDDVLERAGATGAEISVIEAGRGSARSVANDLVSFATAKGAGAIVVGSRGRSAAREILIGSVAMGVLHGARQPVMVVPGEERFD